MKHDGKLHDVEVIGSGLEGLAFAASNDRADIEALHRKGLCEEPTVGGTIAWVACLTPDGIEQIEEVA